MKKGICGFSLLLLYPDSEPPEAELLSPDLDDTLDQSKNTSDISQKLDDSSEKALSNSE